MKEAHMKYAMFSSWVKQDMQKDRFHVNRKVFSVVIWCLILPSIMLVILYFLRKYQWVGSFKYMDLLIYLPALGFTIHSMWSSLRDLPKVFKEGGMNSLLDESTKEVNWRESTVNRLTDELKFTHKEWEMIVFHLRFEIQRFKQQNWYMSILAAVVLFFMFQFLDLGTAEERVLVTDNVSLVQGWVEHFTQWSVQVFSLALFTTLFYLSGLQFQRHLDRYLVCVERILIEEN